MRAKKRETSLFSLRSTSQLRPLKKVVIWAWMHGGQNEDDDKQTIAYRIRIDFKIDVPGRIGRNSDLVAHLSHAITLI